MKKKLAGIYVYFNQLRTTVVTENPAMDLGQLVANFGGLLGLYIGCSIITIVEFLDFFFMFLMDNIKNVKQQTKVQNFNVK